MKKKSITAKPPADAPVYPVGTRVVIVRPHLWAGCVGEIISVDDGLHRIKIFSKQEATPMAFFHADAYGDCLEVDL